MKLNFIRLTIHSIKYLLILALPLAIISCFAPFKKAPHKININKLKSYKKIKDIPIMDEARKLEEAYTLQSDSLLDEFFSKWQNSITVRDDMDYPNPEVEAAYEIFQDFYKPDMSDSSDLYYPNYSKAEFIVVQNHVRLFVTNGHDSLFSGRFTYFRKTILTALDQISDFRPDVHFADKKIVYLSENYQIALDQFFYSFHRADDEGYIYYDSLYISFWKKVDFLSQKIRLARHHGGGGVYYISFPRVDRIIFNKEFTKASISFQGTFASGGKAYYEKEDSRWVQKEYFPRIWVD